MSSGQHWEICPIFKASEFAEEMTAGPEIQKTEDDPPPTPFDSSTHIPMEKKSSLSWSRLNTLETDAKIHAQVEKYILKLWQCMLCRSFHLQVLIWDLWCLFYRNIQMRELRTQGPFGYLPACSHFHSLRYRDSPRHHPHTHFLIHYQRQNQTLLLALANLPLAERKLSAQLKTSGKQKTMHLSAFSAGNQWKKVAPKPSEWGYKV